MNTMRICAKINIDAVRHNITAIRSAINKDTGIVCVIKADAYGHGALPIAKQVADMDGIWGFAVATCEEAKELHFAGVKKPIIILGYTFADSYEDVVWYGFRPTVFSLEAAKAYSEVGERLGRDVFCHIKIDSGMGRIGYRPGDEAVDEIIKLSGLPRIVCEGIFTHFAKADEADKTATDEQFAKFTGMIDRLEEKGLRFSYRHCSNSAAIMDIPDANMDLVRAGIILYGMMPSDEVSRSLDLQPVMSLHSHIVHLKYVEKGDHISYGGIYEAPGIRRIATIPVGYADGYSRGLSNKGSIIIRGKRAPIVGRICMDQFMADVTDIPDVSLLDEVTLLGRDGDEVITMEELGALSGRFNYEFACDLGNRIPRLYYRDGRQVDVKKYYE
ncbi:MAG: alanine racemase [Lachnospiraceae bacterium]|nr:alanine racemase [Lachnospiraceae bacterium]